MTQKEQQALGQEQTDQSIFSNQNTHIMHIQSSSLKQQNQPLGKAITWNFDKEYPSCSHNRYYSSRPYYQHRQHRYNFNRNQQYYRMDRNGHGAGRMVGDTYQTKNGKKWREKIEINNERQDEAVQKMEKQIELKCKKEEEGSELNNGGSNLNRSQQLNSELEKSVIQIPGQNKIIPERDPSLEKQVDKLNSKMKKKSKSDKKQNNKVLIFCSNNQSSYPLENIQSVEVKDIVQEIQQPKIELVEEEEQEMVPTHPLSYFMQFPFRRVSIVLMLKGTIQGIKIKSFTAVPYEDGQITSHKDMNGGYKCEQKHRDLVQIVDIIHKSPRQYSSHYKQARLELCNIRLPQIFPQTFSPIQINRIDLLCFCKKKYKMSIYSHGVTCPKCSQPCQVLLDSITIN